jgi:glycine cleavage system H protein
MPVLLPPFHGHVPADRLYDTRHDMWVLRDGDAIVIGATSFGLHRARRVIGFTAKPLGAEVAIGRGLGTVESGKTVLAVHAPISFRLEQRNDEAEERPALIEHDPWGAGWMVRGTPLAWEEEVGQLVDAAGYIAHIRAVDPDAVIEP